MKQFNLLDYVHEWLDTNQAPAPKEPGVYFIYYSAIGAYGPFCELLYIGSTRNLKRRLSSHHIIRQSKRGRLRITYRSTQDYKDIEKRAIIRFSPLANIMHNKH